MSRTPETIINKTAQWIRAFVIIVGVLAWLIAIGSFQNDGQVGQGIVCILIGAAAFWFATKIKVVWRKGGEIGFFH